MPGRTRRRRVAARRLEGPEIPAYALLVSSIRYVTECFPRSSASYITHVVTYSDAREMALPMLENMLMVLY